MLYVLWCYALKCAHAYTYHIYLMMSCLEKRSPFFFTEWQLIVILWWPGVRQLADSHHNENIQVRFKIYLTILKLPFSPLFCTYGLTTCEHRIWMIQNDVPFFLTTHTLTRIQENNRSLRNRWRKQKKPKKQLERRCRSPERLDQAAWNASLTNIIIWCMHTVHHVLVQNTFCSRELTIPNKSIITTVNNSHSHQHQRNTSLSKHYRTDRERESQ